MPGPLVHDAIPGWTHTATERITYRFARWQRPALMPISCDGSHALLHRCHCEAPPADAGAVRVPRVPGGTPPSLQWCASVAGASMSGQRSWAHLAMGWPLNLSFPCPGFVHPHLQYPRSRLCSLCNRSWRSGRVSQSTSDSAGAATPRCAGVMRAKRHHPSPSRSAVGMRDWQLGGWCQAL